MNQQERKDAINFAAGEGLWGLGLGLVAPTTVFPLLLKRLGASSFEVGLFWAVAYAGILIMQPVGVLLFSHGGINKRLILIYHACISLPVYSTLAALIWLMGPREEMHALARRLIIVCYAVNMVGIGVIIPAWQDWIAGLFSTKVRGKAMGFYLAASALAVSLGIGLAYLLSRSLAFPRNYALMMAGAVVIFAVSLAWFGRVSQGHVPQGELKRPGVAGMFRLFAHSLRVSNYRRYLVGRITLGFGGVATGFVAVHFRSSEGGGVPETLVILLLAFQALPQAVGGYVLGLIGDRVGHRAGVLLGATAHAAGIAVAFGFRGPVACAVCFMCLGLSTAAAMISHVNMTFETCPHDRRLVHITLTSLLVSPFAIGAAVGAGLLIDRIGTGWGIGLCVVPTVLGTLWTLIMVQEPRQIVLGAKTVASGG